MATQTNLMKDILVLNLEKQLEEVAGEMFGKSVKILTMLERSMMMLPRLK